jgi:hypothetical protein
MRSPQHDRHASNEEFSELGTYQPGRQRQGHSMKRAALYSRVSTVDQKTAN